MSDDIRIATVTPLEPLIAKANSHAEPGKQSRERRQPRRESKVTAEEHIGVLDIVQDDLTGPEEIGEHQLDVTI
jgi:hypothetical protein